jgi:hypothetical protein
MLRTCRLWVLFLCISTCTSALVAQPALEMQDTVNWGVVVPDVPPGETAKVAAQITLRNTGTELLRILEVRPSCGCTTAPVATDSLEPGGETTIDVSMNLPIGNGIMHKTLTVRTNAAVNPVRVVDLLVDVQRPLQLSSSFIPFNRGTVGSPIEGAVQFTASGTKKIEIRATPSQSNVQILTPMPLVVEPGTTATLRVAITPKNVGPFEASVRFTTNVSGYEKFELRGYGSADAANAADTAD